MSVRTHRHTDPTKSFKKITSHSGLARFLSETKDTNLEIDRIPGIKSPYAYSPRWPVYEYKNKLIFIRETSHKYYEVFNVPANAMLHEAGSETDEPSRHDSRTSRLDIK